MKKFIELWFKSEDIAVQFSQTSFYDISAKVIKTIVLFVVCVIALVYFLISAVVSYTMNKLRDTDIYKPDLPKTVPQDTQYSDTGLPKDITKQGDKISESDYNNIRKVL
mgnify:CR=1 FL=1